MKILNLNNIKAVYTIISDEIVNKPPSYSLFLHDFSASSSQCLRANVDSGWTPSKGCRHPSVLLEATTDSGQVSKDARLGLSAPP